MSPMPLPNNNYYHNTETQQQPPTTSNSTWEELETDEELEETWTEDIRSFQIVVQLDGTRKLSDYYCQNNSNHGAESCTLQKQHWDGIQNECETGDSIVPCVNNLNDHCDIIIEETEGTISYLKENVKVDCEIDWINSKVYHLEGHTGGEDEGVKVHEEERQEENGHRLEEEGTNDKDEEEEEVSSTIFSSLLKADSTVFLIEYENYMQSACVYGVLIKDLDDARQWVRERMAEADLLFIQRIDTNDSHYPPQLTLDYLVILKELLEEVIDQKPAIETLLQEGSSYLKNHERDSLLCYDIAEIQGAWLHLKDKLRQLGHKPWSSSTLLSDVNKFFATRNNDNLNHLSTTVSNRPRNRPLSLPSSPESIPCSECSQLSWPVSASSTTEDQDLTSPLQLSRISRDFDFDFSLESFDIEDSHFEPPNDPTTPVLGSHISLDYNSDEEEEEEDLPVLFPILQSLRSSKEGSSLPSLFYTLQNSWRCRKSPRKSHRKQRVVYSNEYSSCTDDDSSSINVTDQNLDDTRESSESDGSFSCGINFMPPTNRRPIAASEDNLLLMKSAFPQSLSDIGMDTFKQLNGGSGSMMRSGRNSPSSNNTGGSGRSSPLGVRTAPPSGNYSPVLQKRRRLNDDMPSDFLSSGASSPRDSPSSLHLMLNPGMSLGSASFDETFDDLSDSQLSSQENSPTIFKSQEKQSLRKKYRKDELWAAIKSDYNYLMDGEIIETCKSTESDLSWESDDLLSQTNVSFTEFMQQYKELTEWLNHIQQMTQRQSSSLSEKYLNMTYHEEMLQRSARRKVFNDYAKQLMRRYPSMKEEINIRLQHLNRQWESLEKTISPGTLHRDEATMLRDLEQDLNGLRKWLHDVENRLLPLCVRPHWTRTQLEDKLKEHQALQRDIESHSKIVSAVLKLCEHLQSDKNACSNETEKDSLQLVAVNLERRWHAIWLQSLEWQCMLEDAINKGPSVHPTPLTEPEDWRSRFSYSKTHTVDIHHHHHHHNGGDLDEQSSADEELSALCSHDDVDSDTSNYDVIPFSENEYEKIEVDTDCQDDHDDDGQISPGGASASSKGSGCSSGMDPAIDSALGRSVSDHSINNDHHKAHQRITSDQVNRAVNKVVSFANSADMRASPEPALAQRTREKTKRMLGKGDHDIGYSSESHSNDEPDFGCRPLAEDRDGGRRNESTLEEPAEGSPDVSIERPNSLEAVVLRRRNEDGTWEGTHGDSGTGPSPVTPDKSWRHSMTSAYDTSSQCSEANSPYDLDATLETSADVSVCTAVERCDSDRDERNSSVQDLISAGSQNFYVMTSVESDVDPGANTPLNITTGDDPVREGDADETQELGLADITGDFCHSTPIKAHEALYGLGEPDIASPERLRHDQYPGCLSSPGLNVLDVLSELEELNKERSESLCVQIDSESSGREAGISVEDLNTYIPEEKTPTKRSPGNEAVKKLIQQAELIVRDGELAPTATRYRRRRKHRSKRHHVSIGGTESIPPTESSAMPTEDSHVSSCDASSECTDSEGDYSTGASEDESVNAILANRTQGSMGVGPLKFKSNTLPRAKSSTKRRDHNCSVTELYELSNRLDLSPFSISEGAIDHLSSNKYTLNPGSSSQKLRRTTSEMSSLRRADTPVRAKKRKLKRSASDDTEEKTLSNGSVHSSHRMSLSMPGSRQQSSQEWQSLSSPDQCPSRDTLQQEWLAACQEQEAKHQAQVVTSDVSDSDIPEKSRNALESDVDTEDPMLKSMNSTMESFSENAWDNYQDLPYQIISDDPTEEKLDDSALPWDQNLEFEEDFKLDCAFGSGLKGTDNKVRHRDKRIPTSNSFHEMSHVDDSDSDLEDLHHVIEESRQQIAVAESVLNKHHKDVFDTGLYIDASKYTELVATCQTNIKCMEVLTETIDSGDASINIAEEDMQQVQDIVDKWEDLHGKATERQQQSRELGGLYKELCTVGSSVQDMGDELDLMTSFDDVHDLEYCIKELQTRKLESHQTRSKLGTLCAGVQRFSQQNAGVHMTRFSEETARLQCQLELVTDRCDQQVSKMQSALFSWYDFNETHKELVYLVSREKRELQCLAVTHDILAVSLPDAVDTIHDLKIMKSDFESYENKMWSLRTLSADILPVCTDQSQLEVRQIVSYMESELSDVNRACDDLVAALEEKIVKQGGSVLLYPNSDSRLMDVDLQAFEAKQQEEVEVGGERQSLMWRIFKVAVPLHMALVALLGLVYVLDPELLASFGIILNPQLMYVQGPPPV